MLGGIDRTVLSAGTAEAYGKVGESPFDVALYMGIYQRIDVFQEAGDFSVFFQETDDIFIQSRIWLVSVIFAGIIYGTAIEYITTSVSGWVFRYSFLVGETHDLDGELAFLPFVGKLFQFR